MSNTLTMIPREDGITVIHVPDLTPQTIEAWQHMKQKLYEDASQHGQALRLLYDIRLAGHPSPEAVRQINQWSGLFRFEALPRSIAVLSAPFALGLVERAIGGLPVHSRNNVRAFLTEPEAVDWLLRYLEHAV